MSSFNIILRAQALQRVNLYYKIVIVVLKNFDLNFKNISIKTFNASASVSFTPRSKCEDYPVSSSFSNNKSF